MKQTNRAMSWQECYLERFYLRRPGWSIGPGQFHGICEEALPRGGRFLEIGAGPSNATSRFLASVGEVHGVDIGAEVLENDALASAAVLTGTGFPFPDAHFDGSVSNYVLEHVEHPRAHFAEVGRVLKPGAAYVFRTPNLYHYVALIARATPHAFHRLVANRLRALPAGSRDPYPTYYRCNSRRAIRRLARASGLEVGRLKMIEPEPAYGMSSRALFLLFMAYERLVNSTERLADLRANIFGVLRRAPAHQGRSRPSS